MSLLKDTGIFIRLTALFPFQEDVVMGTLTVRENLHFSASLRLPNRLSKQQRKERVEATLSDLGLFHVAESKVRSCSSKLKVLEEWFAIGIFYYNYCYFLRR